METLVRKRHNRKYPLNYVSTFCSTLYMSVLIDGFGRTIDYVRFSITDRCDLRCVYCMAEEMTFLPRNQVLSIEEFSLLGKVFCDLGVRKIRLTGGEPLIRGGIVELVQNLANLPQRPEICLTTNGTHLAKLAGPLKEAGLDRINISLDSLSADSFKRLTRVGQLDQVLAGIEAARTAGFKHTKLNAVVLKNYNAHEVADLVRFTANNQLDISFIEEMPLGAISEHGRALEFISSAELRELIQREFLLTPLQDSTGGPSRYWKLGNSETRVGFISPHSENFCSSCNRVRVTAVGKLILCLGQDNALDLRDILRNSEQPEHALKQTLLNEILQKPEKHSFDLHNEPQILRFMNMTGG